jgi:hypothetical protein
MSTTIAQYLDTIRASLRLDSSREHEIIRELAAHIEDELEALQEDGLSEDEAIHTCISVFGSAKTVARQIYEAHSQGPWRHALLASLPHLFFCLLFALKWWQGIIWLVIAVAGASVVTIYGWWHSKPAWLFPWLGYFLLPVMAAGLFLLYLPAGWSWLAMIIFVVLALWLLSRVIRRTRKQDWLYVSLMLFPLPVAVCWFIAIRYEGVFSPYSLARLQYFSPWIGLSFLAIALSVGTFVRLRNRWWKIASLFVTGITTIILVTCYAWNRLELPIFISLIVFMLGIFFVPALLKSKPGISGESYPPSFHLLGKSDSEKSHHSH